MSTRKLWATKFDRVPGAPMHRHDSKVKAYDAVTVQRAGWRCGTLRSQYLTVYVDERDGRGWRAFERVDLDA